MAAPVIYYTTSILFMQQGQSYLFTPVVTSGTPAAWAATGLPDGITIDTATGYIGGVPLVGGSGTIKVTCRNSANEYASAIYLAYGVRPSVVSAFGAVNMLLDQDTKVLWNPQITDSAIPPLYGKTGDRINVLLGIMSNGILQDANTGLILPYIKADNDSESIFCGFGPTVKLGAYNQTQYLITIDLASAAVRALINSMSYVDDPNGARGRHVYPMLEIVVMTELVFNTSVTTTPWKSRSITLDLELSLNSGA